MTTFERNFVVTLGIIIFIPPAGVLVLLFWIIYGFCRLVGLIASPDPIKRAAANEARERRDAYADVLRLQAERARREEAAHREKLESERTRQLEQQTQREYLANVQLRIAEAQRDYENEVRAIFSINDESTRQGAQAAAATKLRKKVLRIIEQE
jgi:hypothetical protein